MAKSTSDKSQNTKSAAKTGAKGSTKTGSKSSAKTAPKNAAKTAAKTAPKSAAKTEVKTAAKIAEKTAEKTASAAANTAPEIDFKDPKYYTNRELSWLAFNERVLLRGREAPDDLLTDAFEMTDEANSARSSAIMP